MLNILINLFRKKYFLTIIEKVIKRFEKDNSHKAKEWAEKNTKQTTEEFCRSIDPKLFDEIKVDLEKIRVDCENKLSNLEIPLGGGGNFILLYFLVRKFKPYNVVETGVAAGWSSLAILRAFKKNFKGYLYSSDFPYFRLKNPENYIGYLAKDEFDKEHWYLDARGDKIALPNILNKIKNKKIDILHYDSDKSYSGREYAIKVLSSKINFNTIIIFDDIQDNFHFRDFVSRKSLDFSILKFDGKYVGITGLNLIKK